MSRIRHRTDVPPAEPTAEEPFAFPTGRSPQAASEAVAAPAVAPESERRRGRDKGNPGGNMLPSRGGRRFGVERLLVRLIATLGVIGIGVALGAILSSNHVQGWIIGLVIALETVILSAILWSSRQL